jgi:hypothetical protein
MTTSIKIGFARRDYGRDRYDFQLDLDDLPAVLIEHGVDAAGYGRMPMSTRLKVLRFEVEINVKSAYHAHEAADAKAAGATTATDAMATLKAEVADLRAKRDAALAPYKAPVPEPAAV